MFEDLLGALKALHLTEVHPGHPTEAHPEATAPASLAHREPHGLGADDPFAAHRPGYEDAASPDEHTHQHLASVEGAALEGIPAFMAPGGIDNIYAPHVDWNPSQFHGFGDPVGDAGHWHEQHGPSDCGVVAQASVFEAITGHPLDEGAACRIAQEHGWFDPKSGTTPQDLGKLLNALGVPTEVKWHADVIEMARALDRGDKVIVGLNANEIWTPLRDGLTGMPIEQPIAGHAVWVTGIDVLPDGQGRVILNDSGTPNGRMEVVDLQDFENAWEDCGAQMVICKTPPASAIA